MKWPPCALTCPFTSSNRKTFKSKVIWTVMVSRRSLDQWESSEDHLTTLSIKVLETATSRKTGTTTQPKAVYEYIKQWRIQGRGPASPPPPPIPFQPRPQGAFPWLCAPKAREKRPGDEVDPLSPYFWGPPPYLKVWIHHCKTPLVPDTSLHFRPKLNSNGFHLKIMWLTTSWRQY